MAVFSTPNADFNVLFPRFTGFRHPDHKFEWTRNEFTAWYSHSVLSLLLSILFSLLSFSSFFVFLSLLSPSLFSSLPFLRCSRVADQYGYSVDIGGVGAPPINRTDLGHCSQVATFTLLSNDPPTRCELLCFSCGIILIISFSDNEFVNNYLTVK